MAWKEDFNIGLGEVPAQKLASEYLNRFGVGTSPIRVSVIQKAAIWQYMQL